MKNSASLASADPQIFPHPLAVSTAVEYLSHVENLQRILRQAGVEKRAYTEKGMEYFRSRPCSEQQKIISQLRNFCQIYQDALDLDFDGAILKNTKAALQFVEMRLRIFIPGDFKEKIDEGDIIEIFDYEGTQLYRNLAFFNISDYTLDDFFGHSWDFLYERSSRVTRQIFNSLNKATEMRKCIPFGTPEHYMREKATPNRKIVKVNLKFLAPLISNEGRGEPFAWIASSSATEVVERSTSATENIQFI